MIETLLVMQVTILSGSLLENLPSPIELTVVKVTQCPRGLLKIEIMPTPLPETANVLSISGLSKEFDGTVIMEQIRHNLIYVKDRYSVYIGSDQVLYDAQSAEGLTRPICKVNFTKSQQRCFMHLVRGKVELPPLRTSSELVDGTCTQDIFQHQQNNASAQRSLADHFTDGSGPVTGHGIPEKYPREHIFGVPPAEPSQANAAKHQEVNKASLPSLWISVGHDNHAMSEWSSNPIPTVLQHPEQINYPVCPPQSENIYSITSMVSLCSSVSVQLK